jgi:pyruvate kinase
MGRPVAILQDLAGPKIRVGAIPNPGVLLEAGQDFVLTVRQIIGTQNMVSVSYPDLPEDVRPGDRLLLADGLMELAVVETGAVDIQCKVITGGLLTSHKGINLPTGTIKAPPLTAKDREDLLFGLEHNVDYVALSFVKTADDIAAVKDVIRQHGKDTPVIAKIEKHEALEHLDNIVDASDGIMVARGDLGVEIPLEEVPLIQKRLIRKANASGKPVITATQMLRSMVNSPRPTRAEAADVVNAVLDGTDAVMLSEETASGDYPVAAVGIMHRLAVNAEAGFPYDSYLNVIPRKDIAESVAHAACILADHLDAQAVVTYTTTGITAMRISRFRPKHPIIALSADMKAVRRLALFWGCRPCLLSVPLKTDDMIEKAVLETNEVSPGDVVVIVAGHPLLVAGATNMLRVKKL